jgi:hypothetical protein
MNYKLIAIDLDGTLLTDDKKVPEENKKVLVDAIHKGYEVVIATGRRYWSAKRFVKEIDENLTILANNGNIARNIKDDKVLIKKYLDKDDFYTLIKEGKKKELYPIIHVDNYEEGYDMVIELDKDNEKYCNYLSGNIDRYKRIEDLTKIDTPKVLSVVYVGDKDILEKFNLYITRAYPEKYSSHVMYNLKIAEALLELMNPNGTKWLSLEEYAEEKGIISSEIITIGDDSNDIEMLTKAGLGIAMKNSSDFVKKTADVVTEKDNNNCGVAYTLRKILNL